MPVRFWLDNFFGENYIEKYWTRVSTFSPVGLSFRRNEFLKIASHACWKCLGSVRVRATMVQQRSGNWP